MSTDTLTPTRPDSPASASRIRSVVKLHFANPGTVLWMPLLILGIIFLANVAIWILIVTAVTDPADRADAVEGFQWSGASGWIFAYMMVVAVQSMNATFQFAQGFSVTRRDYYLGTSLAFVLLALIYTAIIGVLGIIEQATGGWGLGGRMFSPTWMGSEWWERIALAFFAFLFFFFVGAAIATVWVRWRAAGMVGFFAALTVLLVAAVFLITLTQGWPAVGAWFAASGPLGVAAWSLVVTAISAVVGFLLLRRATARG